MIAEYVVSTEPTSTTNMTGFLIWTRGSSFLNASGSDFQSILGSSRPPPTRRFGAAARRAGVPPSDGAGDLVWIGLVAISAVLQRTAPARARGSRSGRRG